MNLYVSARLIMYVFLVFEKRTRFYHQIFAFQFLIDVESQFRLKLNPLLIFFIQNGSSPGLTEQSRQNYSFFCWFFFSVSWEIGKVLIADFVEVA